ncbi:MAG TPA: alpha/beta hydrolase domain-containing protein [Vicinamibacterales bacterium]|nr:alpha/beta hydrolase domain-containing protein [Vicinamibacterales bacterium]
MSIVLVTSLFASLAEARVVRLVIEQRRPFADGMTFGTVGPYERLDGTVYMEVDPADPLNAVIVNLDKAPKNARNRVEFSSPFFILKPVEMSRGNGKIFYGVNNRGNKLESGLRWNYVSASNNPLTAADAGDGFLMRLGYTVVDAGWQGDVDPANNRLSPKFPVATSPQGGPIVAMIRVEFSDREIPAGGTFTLPLKGSPNFRPYPVADPSSRGTTLTVRSAVRGPKTPIPADRWAFGRCANGKASLVASATDICLFDGFKVDHLYELTYAAKDPIVMGLGYAVTRDVASFLRYQARDDMGNPNPLARDASTVGIRRAYGSGTSSTGMYMRDFLYLGFNEDESHRKVFDAVNIHIPGTHRLLANVQFADPNTYARQDDRNDFVSTSYPPLTFAVTTDPITGIRDGILKRPKTDPLVIQTDTENEFWMMKASLNVHDGRGNPVPVPDNVRLYLLSNFQHGGGDPKAPVPGPLGMCANPTNPNYHGPTHRALLMALDAWADRGVEPPKSRYPRVEDKTLVPLDAYVTKFPKIPGAAITRVMTELHAINFGPGFRSQGGIITQLPPTIGAKYQVLVPDIGKDGLDVGGIRQMEIRAPLGTNVGWNVRASGRREGDLCGLTGSFLPFAATSAQRQASADPRESLEERYKDHQGYVNAVKKAAAELKAEGFLLEEDAQRFVRAAETSNVLR